MTPACAGTTVSPLTVGEVMVDDPRVCGDDIQAYREATATGG